ELECRALRQQCALVAPPSLQLAVVLFQWLPPSATTAQALLSPHAVALGVVAAALFHVATAATLVQPPPPPVRCYWRGYVGLTNVFRRRHSTALARLAQLLLLVL